MGDAGKAFFGIITLLIGGAILALLVGHASGVGSLIQAGSTGLNTLLNTIENPGGSSNTGNLLGGIGSLGSGVGNLLGGIGSLGSGIGSLDSQGTFGGTVGLVLGGNGAVDAGTFDG